MAGTNPYSLRGTQQNPLARMLPRTHLQGQVYRMGERVPPGLAGYGPLWIPIPFVLTARQTLQARVSVQRDFHLLAMAGSASVLTALGGFRAQFYDISKKRRFSDRGIGINQLVGPGAEPVFLREPYRFDAPDSQIMVVVQNLEAAGNTIELVLFGVALRFNQATPQASPIAGGQIASGGRP